VVTGRARSNVAKKLKKASISLRSELLAIFERKKVYDAAARPDKKRVVDVREKHESNTDVDQRLT
jgi:hypothetical protein